MDRENVQSDLIQLKSTNASVFLQIRCVVLQWPCLTICFLLVYLTYIFFVFTCAYYYYCINFAFFTSGAFLAPHSKLRGELANGIETRHGLDLQIQALQSELKVWFMCMCICVCVVTASSVSLLYLQTYIFQMTKQGNPELEEKLLWNEKAREALKQQFDTVWNKKNDLQNQVAELKTQLFDKEKKVHQLRFVG